MKSPLACALVLVGLAVIVAFTACSRSPSLQSWEVDLRVRHEEVDRLLDSGKPDEARVVLERLFETLKAGRAATWPAGRQAMQDIAYRLGYLALERKNSGAALAYCNEGLALGIGEDLFSANLLVLRGTVHEELHHSAAAATDLHRALLINEALLERTVSQ